MAVPGAVGQSSRKKKGALGANQHLVELCFTWLRILLHFVDGSSGRLQTGGGGEGGGKVERVLAEAGLRFGLGCLQVGLDLLAVLGVIERQDVSASQPQ